MKTLSLTLPEDLARELTTRARFRGQTKSEFLREALRDYFSHTPPPGQGSFLALAGDLVGCLEGPGDLSYNEKHLEDYGQ